MARTKATFSTVDLSRAMKAAKSVGLVITYTKIDPDGSITLGHGPEVKGTEITADSTLTVWQENRQLS